MSDNIDIFDTNDILDEFDVIKDNSHCYAYLTVDIYKSICRFCFDMKISLPENIEYFKEKKGIPVIFSESVYSPKKSSVRGRKLYEDMIDYFEFYQPDFLYGFIDCRLKDNSGEKLTEFYESFQKLSNVLIVEKHDNFIIKEQKVCYSL